MIMLRGLTMAAAILIASSAGAQQPTEAERLFRDAREEMKQQNYSAACSKFSESLKLQPMPGTLLNLSECEERLGHLVESLRFQRAAIGQLPATDERTAPAKDREAELDRRVPRLTIRVRPGSPPGLRVSLDAEALGAEQLDTPIRVNPGNHVIRISGPSGAMQSSTVGMKEGDRRDIVLESPEHAPPQQDNTAAPALIKPWGYVVGGAGVAALAVGTGLAIVAKGKDDDARKAPHYYADTGSGAYCDQTCASNNKDARSLSAIGYAMLGGGAALVVGGLAMILFAPGSNENKQNVALRVAAAPGVAGLNLGGAW